MLLFEATVIARVGCLLVNRSGGNVPLFQMIDSGPGKETNRSGGVPSAGAPGLDLPSPNFVAHAGAFTSVIAIDPWREQASMVFIADGSRLNGTELLRQCYSSLTPATV